MMRSRTSSRPLRCGVAYAFGHVAPRCRREAKLAVASKRHRLYCSRESMERGERGSPRYGSGVKVLDTVLPFGRQRTSSRCHSWK